MPFWLKCGEDATGAGSGEERCGLGAPLLLRAGAGFTFLYLWAYMSVSKEQHARVSCHLVPSQAPGKEHAEGVRASSQEVRQRFEGRVLLWFTSLLEPLFLGLPYR